MSCVLITEESHSEDTAFGSQSCILSTGIGIKDCLMSADALNVMGMLRYVRLGCCHIFITSPMGRKNAESI